jgi:hypothetical protein
MKSFLQFVLESDDSDEYIPHHGTQLGSNDGGIYTHKKTGAKHYIKFYKNPDQAKTEALTGKIYHHMGIHTLNPEHKVIDGKHAVVTKWNEHLKPIQPHEFEHLSEPQENHIGKMYHGGILTKNWDIVGLEHDNIMKHKNGNLHAVDNGGAFNFRAQGGHKDYGPDIDEHKSFRNSPGRAASHVFNHVFKHNPNAEHEGLKSVRNMDDAVVHKDFKESGLSNHEELHRNFMERKKKLLAHYDK